MVECHLVVLHMEEKIHLIAGVTRGRTFPSTMKIGGGDREEVLVIVECQVRWHEVALKVVLRHHRRQRARRKILVLQYWKQWQDVP